MTISPAAVRGYTFRTHMSKLLPLLLLVCLAAAGCGGGSDADGPAGQVRPTPMSAPAGAEGGGSPDVGGGVGQVVALRLWARQDAAAEAALRALADGYMAANPGVVVSIEPLEATTYEQTVAEGLDGGGAADVIQVNGAAVCALSPALAPATLPVLDTNPAARYDTALLTPFVCEGTLYGLPQTAAAPWGLAVSAGSAAVDVAWDFVRYATE